VTTNQVARFDAIKNLATSGWQSLMHFGQDKSLSNLDKQYGLPAGALEYIYGQETSFGANVHDQPGANGAQGPFQIKPSMGGGADLHGFDTSSRRAAEIFAEELKHYHGDALKATAAYHLGDGALDKIIAKFGKAWAQHVPYVAGVQGVRIENATGGNIVTSAAQLTQ
jgi:hypothetical protein